MRYSCGILICSFRTSLQSVSSGLRCLWSRGVLKGSSRDVDRSAFCWSAGCPAPVGNQYLTTCGNTCVDIFNNSQNCGGCGKTCASPLVCNYPGTCGASYLMVAVCIAESIRQLEISCARSLDKRSADHTVRGMGGLTDPE